MGGATSPLPEREGQRPRCPNGRGNVPVARIGRGNVPVARIGRGNVPVARIRHTTRRIGLAGLARRTGRTGRTGQPRQLGRTGHAKPAYHAQRIYPADVKPSPLLSWLLRRPVSPLCGLLHVLPVTRGLHPPPVSVTPLRGCGGNVPVAAFKLSKPSALSVADATTCGFRH